jgi:hypothetical protein
MTFGTVQCQQKKKPGQQTRKPPQFATKASRRPGATIESPGAPAVERIEVGD